MRTRTDTIESTGWARLQIDTVPGLPDITMAHAAG